MLRERKRGVVAIEKGAEKMREEKRGRPRCALQSRNNWFRKRGNLLRDAGKANRRRTAATQKKKGVHNNWAESYGPKELTALGGGIHSARNPRPKKGE